MYSPGGAVSACRPTSRITVSISTDRNMPNELTKWYIA
jgi:hypothetical protein